MTRIILLPLLSLCAAAPAWAMTVEIIPDSHHQQYQTYGLFPEDHNSLLWINGGRAWAGIGGTVAVAGVADWQTQLVAFGSANAGMRISPVEATLLTETVDARAGLALEHALDEWTRVAAGWTHYSGHISDNVEDPDLIGSNLGDEQIFVRVVHDFTGIARVGGTLKPYFVTDPPMKAFSADQFAEWYPFGVSGDIRAGTPYIAMGLEEYGPQSIDLTFHAQAGLYFGEHIGPKNTPQLRVALGFYSGEDPRLKYMQFKDSRETFGYFGVFIDF